MYKKDRKMPNEILDYIIFKHTYEQKRTLIGSVEVQNFALAVAATKLLEGRLPVVYQAEHVHHLVLVLVLSVLQWWEGEVAGPLLALARHDLELDVEVAGQRVKQARPFPAQQTHHILVVKTRH